VNRGTLGEEVLQDFDVGRGCCKMLCWVSNARNLASL
jgi:hypothetical protein